MKNVRLFVLNALEWDAEWPGPRVIVEVSEKASNANGTNVESKYTIHFLSLSSLNKCAFLFFFFNFPIEI